MKYFQLPGIIFGFFANVGGLRKSVRNLKISSSVNRSLSFEETNVMEGTEKIWKFYLLKNSFQGNDNWSIEIC